VLGDVEAHLSRDVRQGALQAGILERDHAAAVAADPVVMVVAGGVEESISGR